MAPGLYSFPFQIGPNLSHLSLRMAKVQSFLHSFPHPLGTLGKAPIFDSETFMAGGVGIIRITIHGHSLAQMISSARHLSFRLSTRRQTHLFQKSEFLLRHASLSSEAGASSPQCHAHSVELERPATNAVCSEILQQMTYIV